LANADIEAARAFHEITKHSYTSVRSVRHYLDWNNRAILKYGESQRRVQ
jgi:hypothetical protein